MAPALIIIDLQNDFVSPNGLLKKKHIPFESLLAHLENMCAVFKEENWPIIAIRSEYPQSSQSEGAVALTDIIDDEVDEHQHLARTHTGRRGFCASGTFGAEFPDAVQDLLAKYSTSPVIMKMRFSAFADTELHEYLQSQNVGDGPLYFAGVTANNCVLTSITSAFHLNYKVFAVRETIGATTPKLALEAFKTIDRYYGSVISASGLTGAAISSHVQQPRRILYWVSGSIPSWRVMICLAQKNILYQRKRLHVMSKPKDTRLPEFLAINARGKTPTLVDEDGTKIIESMAILQYLEAYYPSPTLMPPMTHKENYKLVLQRFHESETLHNVFEDVELLFVPSWNEPQNKERVLTAYYNTLKELTFWERYLQTSAFVAGEELSLADIAFYPNLAYLVHRGLELEREKFPRLTEYCERIGKLPSVVDARPVGYDKVGKSLFAKLYKVLDEEKRGTEKRKQ